MTKVSNDYVLNRSRIKGINNSNNNKISNDNKANGKKFQEVFNEINNKTEVKFSKHAIQRLQKRNINLTNNDIDKISNAVRKAKNKGVKDALIILDENAFITSVKNNTVITATSGKDLKDNVFTNIDGAVII